MLRAVRSSLPTFRAVKFSAGLNVILARRTSASKDDDTVNGLGKSTLVDIIHFCLGCNVDQGHGIYVPQLEGVDFELELDLGGEPVVAKRNISRPTRIVVTGSTSHLPIQPKTASLSGDKEYTVDAWREVLGAELFGLPIGEPAQKYSPTFRSLVSYIIRRYDAYFSFFRQHQKQLDWDWQVNCAYLLGLTWEDASRLQQVKDTERQLRDIKKASGSGVLEGVMGGSRGELEAQRLRLQETVRSREEGLRHFKVLPEYHEIERKASELTVRIHELVNRRMEADQLLRFYQQSLNQERTPSSTLILDVFREAEVTFPDSVRKRFEDVERFHSQVVANRKSFLELEIGKLASSLTELDSLVTAESQTRAQLMSVLSENHALDELYRLQRIFNEDVAELSSVSARLATLVRVEDGQSALRVEKEEVVQQARINYAELEEPRARAIRQFNENSKRLYGTPGELIIDFDKTGFEYRIQIPGSGSSGIENMKIFCFDLMVAQLWSSRRPAPGFLVHDSNIYDGVDKRQVAAAIELAESESRTRGFQYIIALNDDAAPSSDFSRGFDLSSYVRLELTDATADGGLLGFRIDSAASGVGREPPQDPV